MEKKLFSMICLLAAMVLLGGCATLEERAARAAAQAAKVKTAIAERNYKIDVDRMVPLRGTPRHVSSYSVEVRNDSLFSYLPYFGRAYNVPYGGGKGLHFSERIGSYREVQKGDGQWLIIIGVANEEDTYQYTIELFDNGSSSIQVQSREREYITYSGQMELE